MYDGVRFYAVQTKPRMERRARFELEALGLEVYLPVEVTWRKVPAKLVTRAKRGTLKERVETPLMPGYLFVRLRDEFAKVRAIHAVNGFVSVCGDPAPIPDKAIAALREVEAAVNAAHADPSPTFKPDDKVKIRSGPFSGFIAKVISETGEGRVRVLFESGLLKGELGFEADQVERAA